MMITITGGQIIHGVQEYLNEASIPNFNYAMNIGSLDAPTAIAAGSTVLNGNFQTESFIIRDFL